MTTSPEIRTDHIPALRLDLVGLRRDPIVADRVLGNLGEILDLPPTHWYLTGFLAHAITRYLKSIFESEARDRGVTISQKEVVRAELGILLKLEAA